MNKMSLGKTMIIGAGLGGVTLGAAMLQQGFDVELFEQAPALGEIGAGIQLSPNACRVLRALGILDEIIAVAARPTEYRFRLFDSGEVLQTIPLGAEYEALHGFPYLAVHRADLHRALANRFLELGPDRLHVGAKAVDFEETADHVSVRFANGDVREGELLVGADGIKSLVRQKILGKADVQYTGDQAWRAMVPAERIPEHLRPAAVDVWVGPGRHTVIYPLRRGELINMVGCVEYEASGEESWSRPRPWEELKADFAGWHDEVQAVIDAADRDQCYRWALNIREPVRNWGTRRAVLLGDSVHATLPYMAQGAAMALEDAIVLSRSLKDVPELSSAIRSYEEARFDRTAKVIRESTANRAIFHLPTMEQFRAAFAGRDLATERNAWLYSYDACSVDIARAA
jgi:salicylate hydroxylase